MRGRSTPTTLYVQNAFYFKGDRANSDYDLTHNAVFSAVYELPFGQGKKFASGAGRVSNYAIGGWRASSILTLNDGFPFNITIPFDNANVGFPFQRPSINGPLVPSGISPDAERLV